MPRRASLSALLADDPLWRRVGVGLGAGRMALGGLFWAAPVVAVRAAGLPTALGPGADWLARMTAGRDVAIGAGTTQASLRPDAAPTERAAWLLAGALADLGDAVAIRRGVREGRLVAVPAAVAAAGAAAAVLAGAAAAGRELVVARTPPLGAA